MVGCSQQDWSQDWAVEIVPKLWRKLTGQPEPVEAEQGTGPSAPLDTDMSSNSSERNQPVDLFNSYTDKVDNPNS